MGHPLDRPAWSALTSRQAGLALGDGRALRFDPKYGPFGAAADPSPESLAVLAGLAQIGGGLWTVEAGGAVIPPGVAVLREAAVDQMVATALASFAEPRFTVHALGDADAADMLALATLTEPGPFSTHTHLLGAFIGVKDGHGRLIAMAGERMQPTGFTEVSGVCTHPDHRGRGYAAGLMRLVIREILARGDAAFLHVYSSNTGAIALYKTLGFRHRAGLTMRALAPA